VPRLRSSEWLLLAYFVYVALISPFFIVPWKPWILAAIVAVFLFKLAHQESWFRDLAPLLFALAAFREMDWFTPPVHHHHLEQTWIVWDRWLLNDFAVRSAIESTGWLLPVFLELSYGLVYVAAPVALWALFANGRRDRANLFWLAYLAGTLGAYAHTSLPNRHAQPLLARMHRISSPTWNDSTCGSSAISASIRASSPARTCPLLLRLGGGCWPRYR
jgi:hypothetical protein